jgi:WD40 repeat protein
MRLWSAGVSRILCVASSCEKGGLAGVLTGHSDWVFSVAFSPDGKLVVSGSVDKILCTGGLDVIREEAWPLYITTSGVRLCWELEEPKGPKGLLTIS